MITLTALLLHSASVPALHPDTCNAPTARARLLGRSGAMAMREIRRIAGDSPVRRILPEGAYTDDYIPERLNIEIARSGRIFKIWCG